MSQTQAQSRWSLQSSYTRVAVRIAAALAIMFAFYCLVSYGPTLADAHSLLFRFFETDEQARTSIANFVIGFSLGLQVVLGLACAHVGHKLTGKERQDHGGLVLLWLLHPLVMFFATLSMGLAMYSPAEVAKLSSPNGTLFGGLLVFVVVYLVALFVPICNSETASKDNPVFSLAMAKMLVLACFACFVPSKVTLTLLVGSYALDFLLHPVGNKIRHTTAG